MAEALQRARGLAYWRKMMEASKVGLSDTMQHWWRPPRENSCVLARAARAAGLETRQLRVKEPLRLLYDKQAEVPLHLLPSTPSNALWSSNWTAKFARKNLDDYQICEALQDIYAHERKQVMKAGGDGGPEYLSDCRSGPVMLQTFQKAGSIAFMELGTCLVNGKYVVVDVGPWFKIKVDSFIRYQLQPGSDGNAYRSFVCSTQSCLLTIPKLAFEASAYTLLREPKFGDEHLRETALPAGVKFEIPETMRLQLNRERETGLEVSDEFGGRAAIKVAVEIDCTMLGKGNIAFFEPAEVADDAGKVWDRLRQLGKSVLGCSLSGLKLHKVKPDGLWTRIKPRVYLLIPEFLDPEKDVPFEYNACYMGV